MDEKMKKLAMGYMKITMENFNMRADEIEDILWEFEHTTLDMYTDEQALEAMGEKPEEPEFYIL